MQRYRTVHLEQIEHPYVNENPVFLETGIVQFLFQIELSYLIRRIERVGKMEDCEELLTSFLQLDNTILKGWVSFINREL